jgi:hypothetical protein
VRSAKIAILAMFAASAAASGTPQTVPHFIQIWLNEPTTADILAVMPKRALREHIEGRAAMDCAIRPDGTTADCKIADEMDCPTRSDGTTGDCKIEDEPGRGMVGFGKAVLKLAPLFKMDLTKLHPSHVLIEIMFPPHPVG